MHFAIFMFPLQSLGKTEPKELLFCDKINGQAFKFISKEQWLDFKWIQMNSNMIFLDEIIPHTWETFYKHGSWELEQ